MKLNHINETLYKENKSLKNNFVDEITYIWKY